MNSLKHLATMLVSTLVSISVVSPDLPPTTFVVVMLVVMPIYGLILIQKEKKS